MRFFVRFLTLVTLVLQLTAHRLPAPIVEPEENPTPTPSQKSEASKPSQKSEAPKEKHSTKSKTTTDEQAAKKPETRAKPASPPALHGQGRLIVSRAPNFGWNLSVHLQIDGKNVANITPGRHHDGFVPAGHHVLTVFAVPNPQVSRPTSIDIDVRPGRTYAYTAVWDSDLVVLRPSM